MSQQNDLEIRIAASVDRSSIATARREMDSLADTSKASVATINQSVKGASLLGNAYKEAARGASDYNDELREQAKLQNSVSPENNLARLKADAGLGGGANSSGASGGSGLGGAGAAKGAVRGLLGGSPIAEAAETLGDLSEVAGGLIESAGGGAKALLGLGAAGAALAVVVGIAAIAMNDYNKRAEEQARVLGAAIDAQRQINTEISNGLTSEQAQERLSQVNTEYQKQAGLLANLEASYAHMSETLGAGTFLAQQFDATEEELNTQIATQKDLVASLAADQQTYSTALVDGSLATNDALAAEQALAAARSQGVLSAAQAAGELEAAKQSTDEKTKEQIQAQIDAENNRAAQLEAQLEVLKASGDTSEAVTAQIAALENQLDLSADKIGVFTNAMKGAQTEAQKKSIEDAAKATKKLQEEATKANTSLNSLGDGIARVGSASPSKPTSILGIGRRFSNPRIDALNKARDAAAKEAASANIEYANSLIEVRNNLGKSLNDINIGLNRSLQDLGINASRNIQDALAEGAFLSIRNIQRDRKREQEDLEREASRGRIDAQREGSLEMLRIEQEFWAQRNRIAGNGASGQRGNFIRSAPRS